MYDVHVHTFMKVPRQCLSYKKKISQVNAGVLINPSVSRVVEALGEDLYEVSSHPTYDVNQLYVYIQYIQ